MPPKSSLKKRPKPTAVQQQQITKLRADNPDVCGGGPWICGGFNILKSCGPKCDQEHRCTQCSVLVTKVQHRTDRSDEWEGRCSQCKTKQRKHREALNLIENREKEEARREACHSRYFTATWANGDRTAKAHRLDMIKRNIVYRTQDIPVFGWICDMARHLTESESRPILSKGASMEKSFCFCVRLLFAGILKGDAYDLPLLPQDVAVEMIVLIDQSPLLCHYLSEELKLKANSHLTATIDRLFPGLAYDHKKQMLVMASKFANRLGGAHDIYQRRDQVEIWQKEMNYKLADLVSAIGTPDAPSKRELLDAGFPTDPDNAVDDFREHWTTVGKSERRATKTRNEDNVQQGGIGGIRSPWSRNEMKKRVIELGGVCEITGITMQVDEELMAVSFDRKTDHLTAYSRSTTMLMQRDLNQAKATFDVFKTKTALKKAAEKNECSQEEYIKGVMRACLKKYINNFPMY